MRCLLLKTPLPLPERPWAETAKSASRLPVFAVFDAARAMSSGVAEEPPPPPHPAATSTTAPSAMPAHQYFRSIGCHFVTVTGFQSSLGAPFSIVTSVWRM